MIVPDRQKYRDRIQQTLKEELGNGISRDKTKAFYLEEMAGLCERGTEGIVAYRL